MWNFFIYFQDEHDGAHGGDGHTEAVLMLMLMVVMMVVVVMGMVVELLVGMVILGWC